LSRYTVWYGHVVHVARLPDRFELHAHGPHTIVRVIRSAPVTDPGWQGVYDDSFPLPIDALGLHCLGIVPVGQPYTTTAADGEALAGRVLYRSAYQLGLSVDAYGDGSLIVTSRPRTAKSTHGGGTVLLSTYGLDNGRFERVRERWAEWWTRRYEVIEMQP